MQRSALWVLRSVLTSVFSVCLICLGCFLVAVICVDVLCSVFWFAYVLRSVLAIYCLGVRSGHRGLPWYPMICCGVASVCILVVFGFAFWFLVGDFLGSFAFSDRLDLSWSPFGLLRIALIRFLPVFLDLPGLISWLLRSALDLCLLGVAVCSGSLLHCCVDLCCSVLCTGVPT